MFGLGYILHWNNKPTPKYPTETRSWPQPKSEPKQRIKIRQSQKPLTPPPSSTPLSSGPPITPPLSSTPPIDSTSLVPTGTLPPQGTVTPVPVPRTAHHAPDGAGDETSVLDSNSSISGDAHARRPPRGFPKIKKKNAKRKNNRRMRPGGGGSSNNSMDYALDSTYERKPEILFRKSLVKETG